MYRILLILILSMGSITASAVDCGPYYVAAIQAQSSNVLIAIDVDGNRIWKNLGSHTSEATKSFQSIAQQTLAANSTVMMRFPDGHECEESEFTTVPSVIRIYK